MLKKRSSPSLQFLPTATAAVAAMSLRPSPSYRGGRNQWRSRGFSNRPYGPGTNNIVSGNNDANGEFLPDYNPRSPRFRPNSVPPFNPNQPFHPRGQPPPPYSNPYQQFAPPPLYNQNQQFRMQRQPQPHFNPNQQFRPPPLYNQGYYQPNFDQNQQFRPQGQPPQPFRQFQQKQRYQQRRPSDYRNWESAKPGPPPSWERFIVLSYNILADYLAIKHRSKLYFHIPRHILDWEFRKKNIMFELHLWSADILCFQEVDKFQDLEEDLKVRGYSGIWKMRTGEPVDGCAIFWRSSRFKLLHEEAIEFNKFALRDNVAQICVLESLKEKSSAGSSPPACSEGRNKVVICNIHVLYNPRRGEMKLGQVRILLDRAKATSRLWDDAPIVLCGDFNSTPKSSLYNFISEQKLDISGLPRDKISGQYSTEIRPEMPFTSTVRAQSTNSTTQSPKRVDNMDHPQEVDIKGDNTSSLTSQPESTTEIPDSSATLLTEPTHHENTALRSEEKEDSEGNAEDCTSESLENILSDAITDDNSLSTEDLRESHIANKARVLVDETIMTTSADELLKSIEDASLQKDSTPEVLDGSLSTDGGLFVEKPAYDPSAWTPMEIEAATGNSECTTMEHCLKLRSTYSEVEDYSGTRDSYGEPQVTSYHMGFKGTVDYIWRSEGVQTVRVLAPIPLHAMQWTPGFPTKRWGSDHIALVTEFAFNKDVHDEKSEILVC